MNSKFQNALKRNPQACPPIWFMRQAGRYHDHYQALRQKHSFMELCKNPDLAAQVALGPIQDFDFDVSILFSDLLFPLEALGMGLEYTEQGPRLGFQLTEENFHKLTTTGADRGISALQFQKIAVQKTRALLPASKSLIGFVGGPWTLFVYAVEGGHAGAMVQSKTRTELYRKFCEIMRPLLIQNIQLQLDGGAELVMIFDTAAGEVSPEFFQNQLQPDLEALVKAFPGRIGYYSKGTQSAHFNTSFTQAPWAGFGVDHRWNLASELSAKSSMASRGFIQGNFDQALLHLPSTEFKKTLDTWLKPFQALTPEQRAGWVCGLGHGVLPKTPMENVKYFVQRVREVFK
jgi:uroporphyrinogen decarboxylase